MASGLRAGQIVGKYRVTRLIGEGGMAIVFEAVHGKLGHKVAVKALREELARDPSTIARFEREARALSKLKSRHVVRVLDVDVAPSGAPYMVMELLEGRDLQQELERRGPLPAPEIAALGVQACAAIAEAHAAGIVHRDLKPTNLFLADEGDARVLKIIDFGVARGAPEGDARLTRAESLVGTPMYMAPEQFRSPRDVGPAADVWALGATLYEALTGQPPFGGSIATIGISIVNDPPPPIERARPDAPPELCAAILKALEKEPARRHASMTAFSAALESSAGRAIAPPRASSGSLPDAHELATGATLAVTDASLTGPAKTPQSAPDTAVARAEKGATRAAGGGSRARIATMGGALLAALACGVALMLARRAPAGISAAPDASSAFTAPASIAPSAPPPPHAAPPPSASSAAPAPSDAAPPTPAPRATRPAGKSSAPRAEPSTAPAKPPLFFPGP